MDTRAVITIVIADDHVVVRRGLRLVLDGHEGLEVLAEAGTIDDALTLVTEHRPHVAVLDLNMPGTLSSTLEALPLLAAQAPETRIVILTMQEDPLFARRALADGANAYVLKEAADAELVAAIHRAAAGEVYLNPRLGAQIATAPPAAGGPPGDLTAREREILSLIALGHTNTEIGEHLFLSVRTVESHRAHIQRKLGRGSRAELVRYALDHGLLATARP